MGNLDKTLAPFVFRNGPSALVRLNEWPKTPPSYPPVNPEPGETKKKALQKYAEANRTGQASTVRRGSTNNAAGPLAPIATATTIDSSEFERRLKLHRLDQAASDILQSGEWVNAAREEAAEEAARAQGVAAAISEYRNYYYSGGQAQIYLDDVFLDEVVSLNFGTVTNKSPIYGYTSERFDTVAKGNMIVQGSFTINFVSTGYLQILSQVAREGRGEDGDPEEGQLYANAYKFKNSDGFSDFELAQAINQIRGLGNREFRELASRLRQTRDPVSRVLDKFYELPPFDIYAVFGDIGDPEANHTVRQIKDVYLTGQSQVVSANGEPILEQYTFIARDIE